MEVAATDEDEILELALKCGMELPSGLTMSDYTTLDDALDTFQVPTDEDIVNGVLGNNYYNKCY